LQFENESGMKKHTKLPLISVIMSCYNAEQFLSEAIESVLGQSFDNFEFILIDDGSIDNTLQIIYKYAHRDKRIVVVEKENSGLTHSLNIGLEMARGEWIARLDADDIALPVRFEQQIDYLKKNSEIVLLGSGYIEIDMHGYEIKTHSYPAKHSSQVENLKTGKSPFPHSSTIYNRSLALTLGGYRERLNGAEDRDFWLRLSRAGEIACLDEPLIKLRKQLLTPNTLKTRLYLSHAAILSALLIEQGYPDPVEADEEQYRQFLLWIKDRLDELGVTKQRVTQLAIRSEWFNMSNPVLLRTGKTVLKVFQSGYLLQKLNRKQVDFEMLPHFLMEQWLKYQAKRITEGSKS